MTSMRSVHIYSLNMAHLLVNTSMSRVAGQVIGVMHGVARSLTNALMLEFWC